MTQHTPGPWHVEDTNDARQSKVVVADKLGSNGSTVVLGRCAGPDMDGNARLIAAAPSMLDALRAAVGLNRDRLDVVRAAIENATGEITQPAAAPAEQ